MANFDSVWNAFLLVVFNLYQHTIIFLFIKIGIYLAGEWWIYSYCPLHQLHQPNRIVCRMCCSTEWYSKCWPATTSMLWWSTIQKHQLWQHRRGELWHQVPLDHQTIQCITGDKTRQYIQCCQPSVLLHLLFDVLQHLPIQWNEHNIRSRSNSTTGGNTQSSACFKNRFYSVDGKFIIARIINTILKLL